MLKNQLTYDVVIIGAGVAGCATAIALKNHNPDFSVLVVERCAAQVSNSDTNHYIGETLPPHASQQLQNLGIWESFLSCGFVTSYGTSSSWGSSDLYHNEYIYSPYGYGWHLDRKVFDQLMIKEAKSRGIRFLFETCNNDIRKIKDIWRLKCCINRQDAIIQSRFVVDATGKKASFATGQKSIKVKEDQMVGVYRYFVLNDCDISKTGKGTCIETHPDGWWYSATLPNNIIVVACMTDADIANDMQLRKKESFDSLLKETQYTGNRIQGASDISQPRTVAAHTQYLDTVTGNSWLAVGDAASSYDPISSMGIFKSLTMSQFAAFAIADDLQRKPEGLLKYQKIVKQDYKAYQKKRSEYYAQEKRFDKSSFWKRRQFQNGTVKH